VIHGSVFGKKGGEGGRAEGGEAEERRMRGRGGWQGRVEGKEAGRVMKVGWPLEDKIGP
jgi:hypothetical protein